MLVATFAGMKCIFLQAYSVWPDTMDIYSLIPPPSQTLHGVDTKITTPQQQNMTYLLKGKAIAV